MKANTCEIFKDAILQLEIFYHTTNTSIPYLYLPKKYSDPRSKNFLIRINRKNATPPLHHLLLHSNLEITIY